MANTFMKMDGLDFNEIITQVTNRLNADPRFENFRESAIASTLIEIFAGATDITNYYLERRAEESFMDTAKLRSSVILLARSLGYVTTRSIPAESKIKIKLTGAWTGYNEQSIIQIPAMSVFSYSGIKFILKNTITIDIYQYIKNFTGSSNTSIFIELDNNNNSFDIIQGELKEKVISGKTNPQIGSNFQIYRIEDKEFSNKYGENDYSYPVTKVWVGNDKNDDTQYVINRRSLIDWKVIEAQAVNVVQPVCVIRTAISEGIELLFGDGRSTKKGPETSLDNIYIQYIATKGSEANQVGVKDKKIQFAGKVYGDGGLDVTAKVDFYFANNITNGSDMEDIESIRVNAPNIYYSLDRLVSKQDYVNYLKSLTSPIDVKNAIAWGEQEELRERNLDAMIRMFNIVFFSVVGPMYQVQTSPYYMKTANNGLETAVCDDDYGDDSLTQRNYFNVFTKGYLDGTSNLVEQLRDYQTSAFVWKLTGSEVTKTPTDISFLYKDNAFKFDLNYTSDIVANNNSLVGLEQITIDINSLSGYSNEDDFMSELADLILGKLNFNDTRGNVAQNANYSKPALPGISVTYDTTNKRFIIIHSAETPTYITSMIGAATSAIGLTYSNIQLTDIQRHLSKKIVDIVDDLDSRSQVTIRNVYISPTIQTMKLAGTVYIKDLYDRPTEKTKIENDIYSWFNEIADFNNEIYISNITQIIEQYPSVIYADVRFVPDVPINPDGGNFYNGYSHPSVQKYPISNLHSLLYSTINNTLSAYVEQSHSRTDYVTSAEKSFEYFSSAVQDYAFSWKYDITERSFLERFAGTLYNNLLSANGGSFRDWANSDDFIKLISDIHKDYLKIIRYNMMDTLGNIAKDTQINTDGSTIKGGYSLGSEIVKVNIALSYEYKR